MGYEPRATWEITKSPLPQITMRLDQMIEARQVAYDVRRTAEASWERRAHHQRFKEGEQVWLEGRNIHTSHPTAKLAPKRYGPFPITKVLGPVTYQLRLPEQWNIHPVFHVDLLTPYKETEFHGCNFERPLPDIVEGEEEYEVERILDSRRFGRGHQVQYLVHWKGYPSSDDQWILWSDLNAPELLAEFQQENPDAVVHIRIGQSEGTTPARATPLPPTSLSPHLANFIYMSDNVPTRRNVTITPHEDATVQHSGDTFCRQTHTQDMWRPSTPPPILPRKREHDFIPTRDWTDDPNPDTSSWDVGTPDYDFDMSRPPSPALRSGTTADLEAAADEEHWWGNSNGYARPVWGKENSPWPGLPSYQKLWLERDGEEVPYWVDEDGKALCDEPEEVEKRHLRAVWRPQFTDNSD